MPVKHLRAALLATLTAVAVPAVSLGTATEAGAASGVPSYATWQADVKRAVGPAIPWLRNRVEGGDRDLAIVLDIDNTALETHYHPGNANQPVLKVAQWAKDHGVAVLFVTARTSPSSARQDLTDAGYPVDAVCARRHGESKAEGKTRCREELTSDGYRITADIGNRSTDFEGGYYEKGFELPSYGGLLS